MGATTKATATATATAMRTSNKTNSISKKKQQILHMQRAFLQNLYECDVKFPFATLFGGRKHRNQVNYFSESELECGPQDPVGYIYLPF